MRSQRFIIMVILALESFALLGQNISGIVNAYFPVSNIAGNVVTVGTGTGASHTLAAGDHVVLIQMTGIPPVQTGSNMGKYELRKVASVSGSNITLDGIVNTYSVSTEKVQLVFAPYSSAFTVTANVTAKVWDGTTGGVIALKGTNLTLNANIDATGTGFSQANPPTTTITTSLGSGQGSTDGRGYDDPEITYGGKGGGGINGGGGLGGNYNNMYTNGTGGEGGGIGGAGIDGTTGNTNYGVNGGDGIAVCYSGICYYGSGSGGGGGIIGGGGGGGSSTDEEVTTLGGGGGGGGVNGGGGGGGGANNIYNGGNGGGGGGGGGAKGIGNGASAVNLDSGSGAGGGSYGGGGGGASSISGGDDSFGGGGGGSWTGGGISGKGGSLFPQTAGAGNSAVTSTITNADHYLNQNQARIMMGGSGGSAACQSEGFGGGIVILDFNSVNGNNNTISSNGMSLGLAQYCTAISNVNFGSGGAGGGGGGQMILNIKNFTSTTTIEAKGGKGGDGNFLGIKHGGTGGAGGGGGGIWVYGSTASSNTGSQTVNVANTNLSGAGGTAGVEGGSYGANTLNPKNSYMTGTGGAGGNGLVIQSPNAPAWQSSSCSITITANAGTCNTSNNQYTLTGNLTITNAPTSGTLTVSVSGGGSVSYPVSSLPATYSITGLNADGVSHTVTATFSDDASCTNTATFTAPIACGTNPCPNTTYNLCPGDTYTLTADAGLTNYQWYTISGADTLPILGANTQTFILNSIGTYIWSAQQSNGCTIKLCCPGAFVSNNCPTCSITITANAGTCNTSNNQYTLSGNLTIANAPTTGTLTVSVSGGGSVSYPVSSLPATYSITGLNADGVSHTVTATFSDDASCTNTAIYTAPIACGSNPCPNPNCGPVTVQKN